MSEKIRVQSIQCPVCEFNNPDETARCFGCGTELDASAVRLLVTVRRPRQSAQAISLVDLKALQARRRTLSSELFPRRVPASTVDRPRTNGPRTRPVGLRVVVATQG